MLYQLRFDLRNPAFAGVSTAERVNAAVEMASWADANGAMSVMVLEHHGSDDAYLPSPIVLAAAMAGVTSRVRIRVVLVAPFYEPLRLAEDLAVLDALADGRLDVTLAAGYVQEEFDMFGIDMRERPRRVVEVVDTLRQSWSGEPFEFRGRTVRVTPTPHQPGGPALILGGSSEAAARRAARIADGFLPSTPDCWPAYRDELVRLDRPDPGPLPDLDRTTVVLDRDPESAWEELLPYFLHETNAYGAWLAAAGLQGPFTSATPEQIRKGGQYRVLTPEQFVASLQDQELPFTVLQPMVGGLPPDRAWRTLELFEKEVLPAMC